MWSNRVSWHLIYLGGQKKTKKSHHRILLTCIWWDDLPGLVVLTHWSNGKQTEASCVAEPCRRTSWRAVSSRSELRGRRKTGTILWQHCLLLNHSLMTYQASKWGGGIWPEPWINGGNVWTLHVSHSVYQQMCACLTEGHPATDNLRALLHICDGGYGKTPVCDRSPEMLCRYTQSNKLQFEQYTVYGLGSSLSCLKQ